MLPIVGAILFADEIVHIHQELRCGTGAAEHGAYHEDHVDKTTGEGLQVRRRSRVTANGGSTTYQPRIHRNRGAIVGQRRLIVLIYKMVSQLINIFIGQFFTIHLFNTIRQQATVQTDKV